MVKIHKRPGFIVKNGSPTWGPGVRVSMGTFCIPSHAPLENHPLDARREPSAPYLEILCCDPKGHRALLGSRLRKGEVFAYVGRIHNLKDLKASLRLPTPPPPTQASVGKKVVPKPGSSSTSSASFVAKGSMAFLQNDFRCPPMLGARRT